MPSIINEKEIRVIGMSRSGNHAIIQWIIKHATDRVCFLNCAEPQTNPFETARPLNVDGTVCLEANYPQFRLEEEQQGQFSRKDLLIVSHEDVFLGWTSRGAYEEQHDQLVGRSAMRFDALILRDPFNLFASRLKSGYGNVTPLTARKMWKQHARELLGRSRLLKHRRVPIAYNHWIADASYRRRIGEDFGLSVTGESFEEVPICGSGSSFDGLRCGGSASQMKVLDRWRHFADDPDYRAIFDSEMIDLSEAIFGRIPGTEEIFTSRSTLGVRLPDDYGSRKAI